MQLRPVESRILALTLTLLVAVLGYFALLHWWFVAPQLDMNDQVRQLRADEQRYAGIIAERKTLHERLARLQKGQASNSALLAESDPSTASANLMQHVVDVAQAHTALGPCSVTQKMPVQSDNGKGPYRKVTVNINLSCGMHALSAVLYDLEQGTPYLFIDNFSAYRSPVRGADGSLQPLQVQFSLSGYLRQANDNGSGGKAP
jgi:general secretion pathway protein M